MTMKRIQLFILFAMVCISIPTFGKALMWNNPVSINDQSIDPVRNDKKENINGKWFIPHNAGVNIIFRNDGSFVFNDYNAKKHYDETLTGNYILKGSELILKYSDRKSQTFRYVKDSLGFAYIKKGTYYFVKSDCDLSNESVCDTIYRRVPVMPSFPGGFTALTTYMSTNYKIMPKNMKNDNQKIRFVVSLVINSDGEPISVKILNHKDGMDVYEKDLISVIKEMPRWNPGKVDGKNVCVEYNFPFTINLKKYKSK